VENLERCPVKQQILGKNAYQPEDVWEIGCFWKALPGEGFAQKRKVCHGGKSSKLRLAVAFFVNASGESSSCLEVCKTSLFQRY